MTDRTEAVARAIARAIVTKSLDASGRKMEGLAKIIAINQGVDSVWPDLLDEARAALAAADAKVPING
jgi:hypothetical protein